MTRSPVSIIAALDAEKIGVLLGAAVLLALLVLFIVSVIRFLITKKRGWLVTLLLTAVAGLGLMGFGAFAVARAWQQASSKTVDMSTPDGEVTLSVPGHWKTLKKMQKDACLQAGNLFREEYFMVISETKGDFKGSLTDYSDVVSGGMVHALDGGTRGEMKPMTLDGHQALQCEITGTAKSSTASTPLPISYLLTCVETPTGFHQLIMWTLTSKRGVAFPIFETTVGTVKIQDKPSVPAPEQ